MATSMRRLRQNLLHALVYQASQSTMCICVHTCLEDAPWQLVWTAWMITSSLMRDAVVKSFAIILTICGSSMYPLIWVHDRICYLSPLEMQSSRDWESNLRPWAQQQNTIATELARCVVLVIFLFSTGYAERLAQMSTRATSAITLNTVIRQVPLLRTLCTYYCTLPPILSKINSEAFT